MKHILELLRSRVLIKASEWKSTSRIWNSMLLGKAAVIFAIAFTLVELVRHAVNGLAITSLWIGHVGTHKAFQAKAWFMSDPAWLSMNQSIGNLLIDTANLFAGIGVSANELAISLMSIPALSIIAGSAAIASIYVFVEVYLFTSDSMYFLANGEPDEADVAEEMREDIQELKSIVEKNQEVISLLISRALAEEEGEASSAEQKQEDLPVESLQQEEVDCSEKEPEEDPSETPEPEISEEREEEERQEGLDHGHEEQAVTEEDVKGSDEDQCGLSGEDEIDSLMDEVKSETAEAEGQSIALEDAESFFMSGSGSDDFPPDTPEEDEAGSKPLSREKAEEADAIVQQTPEEANLSAESIGMLDVLNSDIAKQKERSADQKQEQQNTNGEVL